MSYDSKAFLEEVDTRLKKNLADLVSLLSNQDATSDPVQTCRKAMPLYDALIADRQVIHYFLEVSRQQERTLATWLRCFNARTASLITWVLGQTGLPEEVENTILYLRQISIDKGTELCITQQQVMTAKLFLDIMDEGLAGPTGRMFRQIVKEKLKELDSAKKLLGID